MAPRISILLLVTLLLAACAAPQPSLYAPKASQDGYAEESLGKNLYRVSFQGNAVTSRERVQDYALYRAAELTLQLGGERFAVHDKQVDRFTKVTRETYDNWGSSRYGPYGYRRPYYGYHPGPTFESELTTYQAVLTIEPFTGTLPGGFQFYEASAVIEQIGPRIERPAAQPQ